MYSWTEYSITNIFEDEVSVILTTDKLGKFKVSFLFVLDFRRETQVMVTNNNRINIGLGRDESLNE